ncbi:cutinase [Choiromyces venosus 120613-1]|uniref:Cutinase n=1 Tax=Choiromyces venosus 120613-1 TaxID=1336337 RepID=A0A3N4JY06_9PEZI|nr:cutinase [Choiromyces venosus 120613-1]
MIAGALLSMILGATLISATPFVASGCAQVAIITARASTELPGEGIIGTVAGAIASQSSQTVSRACVDYPALLFPYASSSAAGTVALSQQLTAQANNCPNQKIVLLGYSQGAHIIGDVLGGGGGGTLGTKTPTISTAIGDRVTAFIQMGDPRHVTSEPYFVGTSTNNGLFPRGSDQTLTRYVSKGQSYCDSGDTFCDNGLNTLVHLAYVTIYGGEATNFVLTKIGG